MLVGVSIKRERYIHSILSPYALCLYFLVVCHDCKNVMCVWRGCKLTDCKDKAIYVQITEGHVPHMQCRNARSLLLKWAGYLGLYRKSGVG